MEIVDDSEVLLTLGLVRALVGDRGLLQRSLGARADHFTLVHGREDVDR